MLSISIKHPDSEKFIDAKLEQNKITAANISVKIDDEFMRCVESGKPYKKFRLKENTPILKISGVMQLEDQRPHYYFVCYHIGHKYSFSVRLPRKRAS